MKKTNSSETIWDVIVIGGGPAGMMAAATAAAGGASVLLLEKNDSLGKKLKITGGGRCNVTNNKPMVREMLSMYKDRGKFLFSTFSQHGLAESIDWFGNRDVSLKEENENRLFPTTNSALTIYKTLLEELEKNKVTISSNSAVSNIERKNPSDVFIVTTANGETHAAKKCILATGGTSRPDTGSTGDGFLWAKKLGHTINKHSVALVPLLTKESWVKKISGISLPDVGLTIFVDGEKQSKHKGKILFTHTGLSGPTILNLSKEIGEHLESGTVSICIDTEPKKDIGEVRQLLTNLFQQNSNKLVRNVLSDLIPAALVKVILKNCDVADDTPCHSVRAEDKKIIASYLKAIPLTVTGLMGKDKAVISAGGVSLVEIDFKTMESKVVSGLYIVGDVLDIDRPSGGYSLQLCWSTGFVAGIHAAK